MLSVPVNKKATLTSSATTNNHNNHNNKNHNNSTSNSSVISSDSIIDDDDNDSISTTDSVNNHHLNSIHNLTPPRTSSNLSRINTAITRNNKHSHPRPSPNSSLLYQSSRTPPATNYIGNNAYSSTNLHNRHNRHNRHNSNVQQRKIWSEPVGYPHPPKSASIAIHRSRPMSINKKKVKSRFDVDFKPSRDNSYQVCYN